MDSVYIRKVDLNEWIAKHFPTKDLISVSDLIGCIEDLSGEIEELNLKIEERELDIAENYKRKDYASQIGE